MECASRSLAFHSYQTSQEIIYQEHLAKGLTGKYDVLSQQMDQLIHDANSQIKLLQDKVQGEQKSVEGMPLIADVMIAQQAEQEELVKKNNELSNAYMDKARSLQRQKKQYDSLKGQVMASHVAGAANDQAELALQTARGKRFIDRMPGARSGTGVYSHPGGAVHQPVASRLHNRQGSASSGSSGLQRGGVGIGPALTHASYVQGRGLGGRTHTGRMSSLRNLNSNVSDYHAESAPVGTPQQTRLPVLGSTRQAPVLNADLGTAYQASPMMQRQTVGENGSARGIGNSILGMPSAARRTGGPLQR